MMNKSALWRVQMLLEAFAKINWSLDITGIREDGYHLMDMVMQPVSIADEITLEPSATMEITTGGFPHSRADESNLAMAAARTLRDHAGYPHGVRIHLHKRIPMGAGMGGGSADAAAVLFGLNRLWNLNLSAGELEAIGLQIGADVPFCLRGGLTRTRGIGEMLEDHACRTNYWLLIIQPCRGLSTREIFQGYHEAESIRHPETENVLRALESGDLSLLSAAACNVLETVSAVRRPEIAAAVRDLVACGSLFAAMTGSGSAVFGVFRSRNAAVTAMEFLARRYRSVLLCHTQTDSIRIMDD